VPPYNVITCVATSSAAGKRFLAKWRHAEGNSLVSLKASKPNQIDSNAFNAVILNTGLEADDGNVDDPEFRR
jgi:hypothetical protein